MIERSGLHREIVKRQADRLAQDHPAKAVAQIGAKRHARAKVVTHGIVQRAALAAMGQVIEGAAALSGPDMRQCKVRRQMREQREQPGAQTPCGTAQICAPRPSARRTSTECRGAKGGHRSCHALCRERCARAARPVR